jgi:hypothetical protein
MKINQKVRFWIAQNDSCMASDCFGAAPEYDWFAVSYYPDKIEGVVIWNKGVLLAQHIYKGKDGVEKRGGVYDISRNGINKRICKIKEQLKGMEMSEDDFFDSMDVDNFDYFYEIDIKNNG